MTMGERIKKAREAKGYSQTELAHLLGYKSRSSINKIETQGRDIPRSSIVEFSKVLGVTPSYLMGWDEEDKKDNIFHSTGAAGNDTTRGAETDSFPELPCGQCTSE